MGNYMPQFKNEEDYNEWMKEQSKKVPRDSLGISTFRDINHFKNTLEDLGMENIKISENIITGIIK